ncbi:MAG: Fe-S cluster assembly protein SufD [Dehalococcoidia bacterium]|jgi:Fe-S cluster assembly protein SufD|nr:Fe-S cluster assembly protein SufD [Dehalococcoidia bacterium]
MTLATSPAAVDRYAPAFESFDNARSPEWLNAIRREAWTRFAELGLPTRRRGNELWKYTNLQPLATIDFEYGDIGPVSLADIKANGPWDDAWDTVVIVDGNFSAQLSNLHETQGLTARSLAEVVTAGTAGIESQFATLAGRENYAFTALNTAFTNDGAYIGVTADAQLNEPVHVVFVSSASEASRATYPRVLASAGANSSFTLVETYINLADTAQLTVPVVEVFAADGADIRHYRVQMENEKSFHIGTTRVAQQTGSKFTSTSFAVGASIGRNDIHTLLDDPGAECTLRGLYMTSGEQQQDQEISTTHAKPHCTSDQFYKGILSGKSHAVFSGKVIVERDAQKSAASQKDLNLLLSRGARIDAKPSLEIYADDVTAAHGATAGHVDKDTLFYLRTRGIDEDAAKAILIRGFAGEMLDRFEPAALNEFVERTTDERIAVLLAESDTIGTA